MLTTRCTRWVAHISAYSMSTRRAARRALAVVAAFASMYNTDGAPAENFIALNAAVSSGVATIETTAPEIVFHHQIYVRDVTLIESSIGTTLSGAHKTRLFLLQNGSKLSLRGVRLENGMADGNCADSRVDCSPRGGAIFVGMGSELNLRATHLHNNRAQEGGGAIYVISSAVTATDCTMTSNSAPWGGAFAVDSSMLKKASYWIGASVTATDCTISANSGHWGAAFAVEDESTVTATDCTISSNSAPYGGAVYAAGDSTLTAIDCTMTSNFATSGGAVFATVNSVIAATNCTMTSNSAFYGGAVYATGDSALTATGCAMDSNSAPWGGAVHAGGDSTLTVIDCRMTYNAATKGGVVYALEDSTITATHCVMTANYASQRGGAVYAVDESTVTATDCTMTSNSAYLSGGAVDAVGSSTIAATDCTMTFNSAPWGGAVAAGWSSTSLTSVGASCTLTVANSVLSSNSALGGGSILVGNNGTAADLVKSIFQSNWGGGDADDGVGIVNLNGQVQCDAAIGCLPVCTVCQYEDGPSLLPTPRPTGTMDQPAVPKSHVELILVFLLGLLGSAVLMGLCRRCNSETSREDNESNEMVQVSSLQWPLVIANNPATGNGTAEHSANNRATSPNEGEEQSHYRASLPWSAIGSSPAPIFAVDHEMRIVSWSPGACVRVCVRDSHGVV